MFLCAFAKLLADLFSTDTETIGITYIYIIVKTLNIYRTRMCMSHIPAVYENKIFLK